MNILYQFGDYKIYDKFNTPTFELFQKWRLEFLSKTNLDGYSVLFTGNAAEKFFGQSQLKTNDIDIVIYNPNIDYDSIHTILHSAFSIGLKHNILIDIYFVDVDVFQKREFGNYYTIRFYKDIVYGDKIYKVWNTEVIEELPNGLWGAYRIQEETKAYKKYIDRIYSGHYLGLKFDLKTLNLISYK